MKPHLPVLNAPPPVARRPARIRDGPRAAVSRGLVCVAGAPDGVRATRFARRLVEAICAGENRRVAVLIEREPDAAFATQAEELHTAGARPVVVLEADDPASAALGELRALPAEVLAIALGSSLAAGLQGLLTVSVWAGADAAAGEALLLGSVDLHVTSELDGIATTIGEWLARSSLGAAR